jgi:trehalose 6-phosphate synthase/phosphatase
MADDGGTNNVGDPNGSSSSPTASSSSAAAAAAKLSHPSHPTSSSRVERLLRERQLRRSTSVHNAADEGQAAAAAAAGEEGWWRAGEGGALGGGSGLGDGGAMSINGAAVGEIPQQNHHDNVGAEKGGPQRVTQRLLVVANRLPVSATRKGDEWTLELSAGGLVSALLGVKQNFETRWIGWAGVPVQDELGQQALSKALAEKGCVPVFLDDETVDQYYNGYCNNVLWPLFHYIGLPQEDRLAATRSLQSQFAAYKRANKLFAEAVFSQYQDGDVVWCHDYHLMFLPKSLKELR